jgi:hypothetical protein
MTIQQLREIINEEYLRGIPEFVLRQATTKYVDEIRQHLKAFVLLNKSENGVERKEALDSMNETVDSLEEKVNQLLQDELWAFTQQV